ncbi:MAG: hypothetical protein D6763_03745 [Alphaproteobacteria bacterium]|nr:MAG: hypothetical protein D6763_03745 [Alphaproteobacteria bacterium]
MEIRSAAQAAQFAPVDRSEAAQAASVTRRRADDSHVERKEAERAERTRNDQARNDAQLRDDKSARHRAEQRRVDIEV